MKDAALSVKDVSVTFAGKVQALRGVSVELASGQIIGFIGPSGAGKTTLIRSIVGRQKITTGSIAVFGLPAGSPTLRGQMSYMTQELSIYHDLTVTENLRYFAAMCGLRGASAKTAIAEILDTVELTAQAKQIVSKLSGGQKQRVSLAVALIGHPKLMVLDEPTASLDPVLREQLWQFFKKLVTEGTTLIISSHVMDEAERCDDLLLIRDGQLVAHGSPRELKQQTGASSVEQSFLKLVGGVS